MGYESLGPGSKAPDEFHVVIEIAAAAGPVKYEVDKDSGCLMVDRFMNVAMHYPANYGYVPGSVIKCRAVAVLDTEDESGLDAKVLAVPTDKVSTRYYEDMRDLADVPQRLQNEIRHFFERYKDLEEGKWVKIAGWRDAEAARGEIAKSIEAAAKA